MLCKKQNVPNVGGRAVQVIFASFSSASRMSPVNNQYMSNNLDIDL